MPPITRELWLYIIRNVNHSDYKGLKRGQRHFLFSDIQIDLSWKVGFRIEKYSKPQLTKALRRLKNASMIETMKATRGIIITVCKYDYYQDPKNYEGNNEGNETGLRRKHEGIHDTQECKEFKEIEPLIFPFSDHSEFIKWWDDWKDYKKAEHRFKFASTKSEQIALNKLKRESGNNPLTAIAMIENSIASGYQGIFQPKESGANQSTTTNRPSPKHF